MPIDLYFNPISPPSRAVLITAKHLGIEFNEKIVDFKTGGHRAPEFLKLNPNHEVPTLDDNGFVIPQSRAINAYLVSKYGPESGLCPSDPTARAAIDRILYFDATSYYPAAVTAYDKIWMKKGGPTEEDLNRLKEKLDVMEKLLGDQKFFAGKCVTIADISIGTGIIVIKQIFPQFWTDKLDGWYNRLREAIPVFKQINDEAEKGVKTWFL